VPEGTTYKAYGEKENGRQRSLPAVFASGHRVRRWLLAG
jgi:hypothetical protein